MFVTNNTVWEKNLYLYEKKRKVPDGQTEYKNVILERTIAIYVAQKDKRGGIMFLKMPKARRYDDDKQKINWIKKQLD